MNAFAELLLAWHQRHGRHDLPWQHPRSAYRVWVAEIMLQQTRVSTVLRYFGRFTAELPDLAALAGASEDRVLALWSGLGYYRRARFMHQAAKICMREHAGELPQDFTALKALPGIGRSTAAAILAQAHGQRHAILDGNAKRVLARYHGLRGWPGDSAVEKQLWTFAEQHTPHQRVADYTQAIMDLGATLCTRAAPQCGVCPVAADCIAQHDALTELLPERRRRKPLPERATCMLILRDDQGRVLLQRRNPNGVWPCLWSLPEAASRAAAKRTLAKLGVSATSPCDWPSFTHEFTHFRLRVQPLLWQALSTRARIADNADQQWCGHTDWPQLGLPAPVRRLLESLSKVN